MLSTKKADLNKVMTKKCQHLYTKEQERLLEIIWKLEYMFDGTLGTYNTTPVALELNNDAKTALSRTYPVPRIHT